MSKQLSFKESQEQHIGIEGTREEEAQEEEEIRDHPFNPKQLSINTKTVSMDACLRRLEQETLILNPDFQRNEVWTPTKRSQMIESLMLKIPLPMFYVSADEKGIFTVVDGLQRLSTIRDFVLGKEFLKSRKEAKKGEGFPLQDLEFWREYNGRKFNKLPVELRNRIHETELNFTIIDPGSPEAVRRNVFKRVNTGGEPLSSQEIRNALYLGKSTKLLKKLSQSEEFKDATKNSVKPLRMEDQELVLRFLAFLIRDFKTYKKTLSIDTFLSDTMVVINASPAFNSRDFQKALQSKDLKKNDINRENIEKAESFFKSGMKRAQKLFKEHCFRRSYGNNRRSRINKSLFEMWGVLLSQISEEEFRKLFSNCRQMLRDYQKTLKKPLFQDDITKNSMKNTSVVRRFKEVSALIQRYSQ